MGGATVYMFPGQGSQSVGMRGGLGAMTTEQKELFSSADAILGFPLSALIDAGPGEELTRTSNTQPALLVMGTAFAAALDARGHRADIVMGHSLGEYTALVHAGVIDFKDAVRIVRKRGELMEQAVKDTPGTMAAVIGVERARLESVVQVCVGSGVIEIANFNSSTQMVISGQAAAVDAAARMINDGGIGRAVALNVSAPFHTSLMKPVAEEFSRFLSEFEFRPPRVEFIDNVTGRGEKDPANIRDKLVLQLYSPVQWEKSVLTAADAGAGTFIESGPGTVLSGLVKRIVKDRNIISGEKLLKGG
ncbi:MAG: [acyl-carrier-protein] S-malonyltransferase [Spirochaetes bacterium RBG_13_51_14]|nr:MAG: [acyl-carrier-protein] S-malonyltransferase [Spirochaetes bacterium RBG_13_51_14]